jgi:hypothetical protein
MCQFFAVFCKYDLPGCMKAAKARMAESFARRVVNKFNGNMRKTGAVIPLLRPTHPGGHERAGPPNPRKMKAASSLYRSLTRSSPTVCGGYRALREFHTKPDRLHGWQGAVSWLVGLPACLKHSLIESSQIFAGRFVGFPGQQVEETGSSNEWSSVASCPVRVRHG